MFERYLYRIARSGKVVRSYIGWDQTLPLPTFPVGNRRFFSGRTLPPGLSRSERQLGSYQHAPQAPPFSFARLRRANEKRGGFCVPLVAIQLRSRRGLPDGKPVRFTRMWVMTRNSGRQAAPAHRLMVRENRGPSLAARPCPTLRIENLTATERPLTINPHTQTHSALSVNESATAMPVDSIPPR